MALASCLSPPDSCYCIAWAKAEGATLHGISVCDLPGRGNSLIVDTTEGGHSPNMFVPKNLLLTLSNINDYAASEPEFYKVLQEWSQRVNLTSRRAILLLMAWNTRHGTPWREYLSSLPAYVDSPILWTDQERSLLKGTSIEGVAEDRKGFLKAWLQYQQNHSR